MTTEDKFQAAVNIIRGLPKDGPYQPSHSMMLKFYGLYKQAMEGPCTEPKPAFYEVVKGYKWQAWNSLGTMTKSEAKNCYVDELKKIIETMSYTENVANFIDTLGPFYEYIDIPGKKKLNNNNTATGPHQDDTSDSGNEMMDSHTNTPVPNGVHLISNDSSPRYSHKVNGMKEVNQKEEEDEGEEDLEIEEGGNQMIAAAAAATIKVLSDSESDEEYSEPAEQLQANYADQHYSTPHSLLPQQVEAQEDALMHGGGDKSYPGGLQMIPGQSMQGRSSMPHTVSVQPHSMPLAFPSLQHTTQPLWSGGGGGGGGASGGDGGGGGSGGGGGGGRGGRGRSGSRVEEDVNTQLMVVLRRLQTDMESVLHRLNTLETLTLTQHHVLCRQCQGSTGTANPRSERSWWPFPELSPRSTFFLLLWPILLHLSLRLLPLIRCRRKRS